MRLGPGADNDPRRTLGFTYNGQSFGALAGDTLASALMAAGRLELGRGAKTGRPRGLRWLDRASDMRVTSARGSPGNDPATMVVRDRMTIRRLIRVPKAGASASAAIVSTEILVIGGGAAGLIAALTAARAGASVVLVEAQRTWGGALWGSGESIDGRPARAWIADIVDELTRSTKVKLLTGVRIEAKSDMTWKARDIGRLDPEPENFEISARVVIMATGAVERMIGFAGNDLPGVMTASTMRAALYRWGVVPGSRIAVFGVTGEVQQTTQALVKAGLNPVAMINANGPQGGPDGVPAYPGGVVRRAQGDRKLEGITVVHEGETETIACDGLAIAGGWSPSILVPGLDATPIWNAAIAAWLCPPGAVPGLEVAGAAGGSYSTRAAMKSGYFRARRAVSSIGLSAPDLKLPQAIDLPTGGRPAVVGRGRRCVRDFSGFPARPEFEGGGALGGTCVIGRRYCPGAQFPGQSGRWLGRESRDKVFWICLKFANIRGKTAAKARAIETKMRRGHGIFGPKSCYNHHNSIRFSNLRAIITPKLSRTF